MKSLLRAIGIASVAFFAISEEMHTLKTWQVQADFVCLTPFYEFFLLIIHLEWTKVHRGFQRID